MKTVEELNQADQQIAHVEHYLLQLRIQRNRLLFELDMQCIKNGGHLFQEDRCTLCGMKRSD
jgi:hypothetical protein